MLKDYGEAVRQKCTCTAQLYQFDATAILKNPVIYSLLMYWEYVLNKNKYWEQEVLRIIS